MAGVSINFESWDWQEGRSGQGSCLLTPSGIVQINLSPGAQRSEKLSDLQARQMSARQASLTGTKEGCGYFHKLPVTRQDNNGH